MAWMTSPEDVCAKVELPVKFPRQRQLRASSWLDLWAFVIFSSLYEPFIQVFD
jgi:hypothetical protein